jgi:hypothetical protein
VPVEDLPTFGEDELERRATDLLRGRYRGGVPVPVDIEWLLETTPGVDFDCYPALRANYAIDGGVWADKKTGGLLACVDEGLMDDDSKKGVARYRWVVAEQLAHLLIHQDVVARLDGPEAFREFDNRCLGTRAQRNTERLAAALLMPAEQLVAEAGEVYQQLVRVAGTDNPEAIKKYLGHRLAERFQVADRAMGHRLTDSPMRVSERVEESLRRGLAHLT